MNTSSTLRNKLGELLQTNRVAMFLEIAAVFLPLYLGLVINDSLGIDHIPLGGNTVLLQGPIAYLGVLISVAILWIASWLRGASWSYFGLTRPKSWFRTVLLSLGVTLGILVAVGLIINPVINALNLEPRDMSMFNHLTGNLPTLTINLVVMWITAAFLEELLWRGYLMNRLIDLLGKRTWIAWLIVLVISAVLFGLVHSYQGTAGMIKTGAIGFVFGLAYIAVGRNLWPLIFSHGLIDSYDFVAHYLGG